MTKNKFILIIEEEKKVDLVNLLLSKCVNEKLYIKVERERDRNRERKREREGEREREREKESHGL